MRGLAAVAAVLLAHGAAATDADAARPWMDAELPIEERVSHLLAQMNREEKIAMTFATHTGSDVVKGFNKTGVGAAKFMSAFSCPLDNTKSCVQQRNELQQMFKSSSRLGIPISFINEGLHGGAAGGTIFPEPIGQAMSWNVSLVSKIAGVIATEASAIGVDSVFAPVVNMMTDPRFGRLQEGFGENPIIAAHMGRASVLALQGGPGNASTYLPDGHVCSLGKHFGAYGAAIGGLNGGPADVSNRTLHEVFLRPWMALGRAGVRAVMPSHNAVGDVPCHANHWMLQQKLRDEYGFGGVALSDCDDIGEVYSFGMAPNRTAAAALSLNAGVDWDLQCGTDPAKWSYNKLGDAIDSGLTTEAALDKVVTRVLRQKFASGLFDGRSFVPYDKISLLDSPPHRQLALEAAEQSIVLLQNKNDTLPMALAGKKVALFGAIASGAPPNTTTGTAADADAGSAAKGKPTGSPAATALVGSYVLDGAHVVTIDEALREAGVASLTYIRGADAYGQAGAPADPEDLPAAVALAKESDVSIVVLGDDERMCGEWQDRDSLDVGGGQLALLEAVSAVSKQTIVVLVHGRPQTFGDNSVLDQVDAMLAAWRPGEEGGHAIVNLLTGKANPSAKLAQSWPRTVGHVHSGSTPWLQRVRGKWVSNSKGCDYDTDGRCYDAYASSGFAPTPLFYFGAGLSYTSYTYSGLTVAPSADVQSGAALGWSFPDTTDSDVVWHVSVTVTNTGKTTGQEIVQIYVQDPRTLPFVPYWKRMLGFARTPTLAPGAKATLTIPLLWVDVAMFDDTMNLRLWPGSYIVSAGGASNDTPVQTTVTL